MTVFPRTDINIVVNFNFVYNGVNTVPESYGFGAIRFAGTDTEIPVNSTIYNAGGTNYLIVITLNNLFRKVTQYEILIKDVKFTNDKKLYTYPVSRFTLIPTVNEFSQENNTWTVYYTDTNYITVNATHENINQQIFSSRPNTFFYENNTSLYENSEINATTEIPDADVYIFPVKPIWATNPIHTGLISYFKNKGSVGLCIPATYVDTNITYSGFSSELYNSISGLESLQISTSGNLIHVNDANAVYNFWNQQSINKYFEIISKYNSHPNSGVDFILFKGLEDFYYGMNINDPDPMLDYITYGWDGNKPWNDVDWNLGIHKIIQSGSTSDLYDIRFDWFSDLYNTRVRLDESPASTISGTLIEDLFWYQGELWKYINNDNQSKYITAVYKRECSTTEAELGKALAMMTDAYFSPGEADYTTYTNYDQSLYQKYNIGEPLGKAHKIGHTIVRNFSNGKVEIDDIGFIDENSVRICVGEYENVEQTNTVSPPTGFMSMVTDDRIYSMISSQTVENYVNTSDYWRTSLETAYNNQFSGLQLEASQYSSNIKFGARLYYTDWPESLWRAEYTSGLDTYGSFIYPTMSGITDPDSIQYRIMWYKTLQNLALDFYIIPETTSTNIAWFKNSFIDKEKLYEGYNENVEEVFVSGLSLYQTQVLKDQGKYVWCDDLNIAAYLELGFHSYGVTI